MEKHQLLLIQDLSLYQIIKLLCVVYNLHLGSLLIEYSKLILPNTRLLLIFQLLYFLRSSKHLYLLLYLILLMILLHFLWITLYRKVLEKARMNLYYSYKEYHHSIDKLYFRISFQSLYQIVLLPEANFLKHLILLIFTQKSFKQFYFSSLI